MSAVPHSIDSSDPVSLHNLVPSPEAVLCLSETIARRLNSVPLSIKLSPSVKNRTLLLGVTDPDDEVLVERLQRHLASDITASFLRVDPYTIDYALDKCYETGFSGPQLIRACAYRGVDAKPFSQRAQHMVRLVEWIINGAYSLRASDIHLTITTRYLHIRLRIDGVLRSWHKIRLEFAAAIAGRIKVLALMDIAESRHPQDGHFNVLLDGVAVDFRVSSFPTVCGENFVLRVLSTMSVNYSLNALGFSDNIVNRLTQCIKQPDGLIVFCGPTGSGKSTSLHALMGELDEVALNIMTLEDPVENILPGIQQTTIDASHGFDYAEGLRASLRQDPDVLMIGEVRDANSGHMMLRAVMTGHKVLTSIHATDAIGAISRLVELGVSRDLLSANLACVVSQRLVRTTCDACDTENHHCKKCQGTGYFGRVAIAEVLIVTDKIAALIREDSTREALLHEATLEGYIPMHIQARELAERGRTKELEVNRVFGTYKDQRAK